MCSKCGSGNLKVRWCGGGMANSVPLYCAMFAANRYGDQYAGDHLHRSCFDCDFEWLEKPLDATD